jgi:hypothetical protein
MPEITTVEHAVHAENDVGLVLPDKLIVIRQSNRNFPMLEEAKEFTNVIVDVVEERMISLDSIV